MKIVNGPGKGFSQNFFSLIWGMKDLSSDFYAFADQDDIWEPEKLSTAIKFFINEDYSMPLLYCSRTKLIDEKQSSIGYSPLFKKKPTIYNALVQSIAGGNTMIINRKTLELAASIGNNKIISHDWLLYLMVTSVNGKVKYDEWPSVLYRQHGNNKIGNNMMLSARLKRLYFFLRGDLKSWIDQNLILLEKIEAHLSMEAKEALNHLIKLREMPWYEVFDEFSKN